jgi:hypothetical protein
MVYPIGQNPFSAIVSTFSQTILPKITPLVALVATPQFRLLQGLGICSYGFKEVFYDSYKCHQLAKSPCVKTRTKWQAAHKFFLNHGALFAGCGIAGTAVALHYLEAISAGPMLSVLKHLDLGLFLAACVVALQHNVKEYQRAKEFDDNLQAQVHKNSAILGIISSLNYMIWSSLLFFEFSSALTFVFCAIGLLTGCWKILFDFFYT